MCSLTMQDIAIAQAWFEAAMTAGAERERASAVLDRIELWKKEAGNDVFETAGRRQQMLLRELIGLLNRNMCRRLTPDEIAVLYAVYTLSEQAAHSESFSRLQELLGPYWREIQAMYAATPPRHELPSLENRICYATEDMLRDAPIRSTRLLAGIELPCRGPVFSSPCNLRIVGDVPQNCTAIAEGESSCSVEGYVLGRVLARFDCEVRGNISGVVVVLHGNVRARSIINNAQIVAKLGGVECITAQGPRLVFGGKRITIQENAMLGHFISRVMNVAREARGGIIEIAELLEAGRFRNFAGNTLKIVMRQNLSCEDFGEVTGHDLKRLLSSAYRLRRLTRNYETLAKIARQEAEQKAQTVMMYLIGGSKTQIQLQDLNALQRRMNMLDRIIRNIEQLIETGSDSLTLGSVDENSEVNDADLLPIDVAEIDDPALLEQSEEAMRFQKRLNLHNSNRNDTTLVLYQMRQRLIALYEEYDSLRRRIADKENEIQTSERFDELFASNNENSNKLQALDSFIAILSKKGPGHPIARKLQSGLVTVSLHSIDRLKRNIRDYETRIKIHRDDFRTVSDRLGKDFQMQVLERPEDEEHGNRIVGVFDDGIKIYMDTYVENDSDLPKDCVITTKASDQSQSYIRSKSGSWYHLPQ